MAKRGKIAILLRTFAKIEFQSAPLKGRALHSYSLFILKSAHASFFKGSQPLFLPDWSLDYLRFRIRGGSDLSRFTVSCDTFGRSYLDSMTVKIIPHNSNCKLRH